MSNMAVIIIAVLTAGLVSEYFRGGEQVDELALAQLLLSKPAYICPQALTKGAGFGLQVGKHGTALCPVHP